MLVALFFVSYLRIAFENTTFENITFVFIFAKYIDFSQPLRHLPTLSRFIDPEPLEERENQLPFRKDSACTAQIYTGFSFISEFPARDPKLQRRL